MKRLLSPRTWLATCGGLLALGAIGVLPAQGNPYSSSSSEQSCSPGYNCLGSEVILERPGCDRLVGLLGGCGSFNVSQSRRNADSCNSPECLVTNIEKVYASEQPGAIAGSLQQAIAEIRRAEQLTGSRTAVVYTYIREQQLELVVLSAAGKLIQKSVFIPGGYQEIRDTVRRFVEEVRDPSSQDYLPFARTLYSWLIAPIEADLRSADTETLVFVMDGPFRTMPISALYDGQRFLVQKYNLATVPNMGSVNFAQRDRRRNTILAMGLTEPMQGFSALPNVGLEVQTITSRVLQGESFLNQQFTINNLKSRYQAQNFGIIHLATHGEFVSNAIDGAFLQFWNERLFLNEMRNLQLHQPPLEMLTLSACVTAVGNNLGLGGVAVQSGVKSVLASLWTVSDAGTVPLMLNFYSKYPTAKSKAIALREAQVAMIEGKVTLENNVIKGIPNLGDIPLAEVRGRVNLKHPYFWSSFTLIGSWL